MITTMMTPAQARDWRRRMGLIQREAAERIGISRRQLQAYETGAADLPWTVVLAMRAVAAGLDGDREAIRRRSTPATGQG